MPSSANARASSARDCNPTTKVIDIYRSNDGAEDHFNVGTLLHELGHRWAYDHTSGEICLTETLLLNGDTHTASSATRASPSTSESLMQRSVFHPLSTPLLHTTSAPRAASSRRASSASCSP